MPTYSFVCEECGLEFDRNLHFNQVNDPQVCPRGHAHVRRIFSTPSIVFKGSGWYSTDHRRKESSGSSS